METVASPRVLDDAQFIQEWEKSNSSQEVAKKMGLTKAATLAKASMFRTQYGAELKYMPRDTKVGVSQVRFSAAQKILAEIRNISLEEVQELHNVKKEERVMKRQERLANRDPENTQN
jgi:hypothetical protein